MVSATPSFTYHEPFPLGEDTTAYRKLEVDPGLVTVRHWGDREMVEVQPEALTILANQAMKDCSFMLRTEHLAQVAAILDDPEASPNDRGVALAMLRNAVVSSRGILRNAVDRLGARGMDLVCGLEVEFYVFRLDDPPRAESLQHRAQDGAHVSAVLDEKKGQGCQIKRHVEPPVPPHMAREI